MTSIFDKWTDIDPALALRRIEAAHGSQVFDNYAYLDPQRALIQIETAFGIELDDVNGLLDPSTLEDAIDTAIEAEADSTPDWVPDDAKIYIDLVNDRAWTEADGEVAIDTLLGSDPNTVNGWGETSYDAGNLTADGYVVPLNPVALIGSARSIVLASATVVMRTKQLTETVISSQFALLSEDGQDAVEFDLSAERTGNAQSWNGSLNNQTSVVVNQASGAVNVLAFTVTNDRADVAASGSDAVAGTLVDEDRPTANPLVAVLADTQFGAIQSITIYDPLPSTAGLSALSETGVTNTAPTININWYELNVVDGVFSVATQINSLVASPTVVDAEGNPCLITMVACDTFLYSGGTQDAVNLSGPQIILNQPDTGYPPPADYSFTLRATDPGGLYVEQEFTITVTA